ncbi:hypothetical protein EON83_07435 [bacterium]|nr:MAG: hypothetical protein EON83_07435 [bacterium]
MLRHKLFLPITASAVLFSLSLSALLPVLTTQGESSGSAETLAVLSPQQLETLQCVLYLTSEFPFTVSGATNFTYAEAEAEDR